MNPQLAAKVENLADSLLESSIVYAHMRKLTEHYKISIGDITAALLTRQVLMMCLLTDFAKEGSPSGFSQILKQQNALELSLADRMSQTIQKATDAISTAENLQEEATRFLAKLRKQVEEKAK